MAKQKKHHGVVVPMVTPFTDSGEIDIAAAKRTTTTGKKRVSYLHDYGIWMNSR